MNTGIADQVMWLAVPVAAVLFLGLVLAVRRHLSRPELDSYVLWGGWTLFTAAIFSFSQGTFHNYYVSLLAPGMAALAGIGVALVVRSGAVGRAVAALALLASSILQVAVMGRIDALTWLRVAVPAATLLVAASLLLSARPGRGRPVGVWTRRRLGYAAALVCLAAPAAWSWSSLGHASSGTFPEARPVALEMDPTGVDDNGAGGGSGLGTGSGLGALLGSRGLAPEELGWLRAQRRSETWLVAVRSSMEASDPIIAGDSVMSAGGFDGQDPALTQTALSPDSSAMGGSGSWTPAA